jgi:hypothetical protein
VLAGAAAVVVVAVGAAVLVPVLRDSAGDGPVPAAAANGAGQLQWPARGALAGDTDLLRSALRTWQDGVPERQRPAQAAVLWAGTLDGARTVVLQGTDGTGQSWVADVSEDAGTPTLRSTEPLGRTLPLLALGSGDQVRLLAAPGTEPGRLVADGGAEMRALNLADDGMSEPVSAPGSGLRVALTDGSAVVGSGTVLPGRLSPITGTVELIRSTLGLGPAQAPTPAWYDDGDLIARRLGGPVDVVQVGPTRVTPIQVGQQRTRLEARAYEAVRGGTRYLAAVVRVDGSPACTDVLPAAPADAAPARPRVLVSRCIPRGAADGVVLAVATGGVRTVRVTLAPATPATAAMPGMPAKPGRPARVVAIGGPTGTGLVGMTGVPGLPSGAVPAVALGAGDHVLARLTMPAYRGPRS